MKVIPLGMGGSLDPPVGLGLISRRMHGVAPLIFNDPPHGYLCVSAVDFEMNAKTCGGRYA